MSLLFGSSPERLEVWSVSELTLYIRELFEIDHRLQELRVEGEISNLKEARSGHLYFTLKDSHAQLKCVMWRSAAARLPALPSDGDAVIASGHVSVYERNGVYQLYVDRIRPAGRGDLAQAFEELKQRLEADGIFAQEHKRPLPPFPTRIGVVTSADAAALRDILNVLKRRSPYVSVLIAPTLVQGPDAPPQIVRALQWLDGRLDIDTIIVARGGGSLEDLWAFNDERVARAIFAARHPVISGVGHETDYTIADFVADVRAPTPSAAAELAAPDVAELQPRLVDLADRLVGQMQARIEEYGWRVASLLRNLRHLGPKARLDSSRQYLDGVAMRLEQAIALRLERGRNRLDVAEAHLASVSPRQTLQRGYAIVRHQDGSVVRSVGQIEAGDPLQVQVSDGEFRVAVSER